MLKLYHVVLSIFGLIYMVQFVTDRIVKMQMTNSDYLLVLTIAFISTAVIAEEEGVPITVIRRPDYDTVLYLDSHEDNCTQTFSTYLMDERMCVSDQELLNGNVHKSV